MKEARAIGVALGCALGASIVTGYGTLLLVSIIIGFCYGSGLATFPTYLGDLFGMVNMPTLFGLMMGAMAVFTALGPILYGNIRTATGSYELALWITSGMCLVSAVCLYPIRQPKKKVAASSGSS